jgi:hypothetical protein
MRSAQGGTMEKAAATALAVSRSQAQMDAVSYRMSDDLKPKQLPFFRFPLRDVSPTWVSLSESTRNETLVVPAPNAVHLLQHSNTRHTRLQLEVGL